jgi:hypothetical protein
MRGSLNHDRTRPRRALSKDMTPDEGVARPKPPLANLRSHRCMEMGFRSNELNPVVSATLENWTQSSPAPRVRGLRPATARTRDAPRRAHGRTVDSVRVQGGDSATCDTGAGYCFTVSAAGCSCCRGRAGALRRLALGRSAPGRSAPPSAGLRAGDGPSRSGSDCGRRAGWLEGGCQARQRGQRPNPLAQRGAVADLLNAAVNSHHQDGGGDCRTMPWGAWRSSPRVSVVVGGGARVGVLGRRLHLLRGTPAKVSCRYDP